MVEKHPVSMSVRGFIKAWGLCMACMLWTGCREEGEKAPETMTHVRVLGAHFEPSLLSEDHAGKTLPLKVWVAAPASPDHTSTLTVTPETDWVQAPQLPTPMGLAQIISQETVGNVVLFSVSIEVTAPSLRDLPASFEAKGFAKFYYGFRATLAPEGQDQAFTGHMLWVQSGSPAGQEALGQGTSGQGTSGQEASEQKTSVQISSPKAGDVLGTDFDVVGELRNPSADTYKLGWFVSSGTVSKRRTLLSHVKGMSEGTQTLILTARGQKTGFFTYAAIPITVTKQ